MGPCRLLAEVGAGAEWGRVTGTGSGTAWGRSRAGEPSGGLHADGTLRVSGHEAITPTPTDEFPTDTPYRPHRTSLHGTGMPTEDAHGSLSGTRSDDVSPVRFLRWTSGASSVAVTAPRRTQPERVLDPGHSRK